MYRLSALRLVFGGALLGLQLLPVTDNAQVGETQNLPRSPGVTLLDDSGNLGLPVTDAEV